MANSKQDIRLQIYVTEAMDDKIDFMAESMGLRKSEFIKLAIANYIGQWSQGVEIAKSYMKDHPELVDEALGRKGQASTGKP